MTPRARERFRVRLWSKVYAAVIAHRSGLKSVATEAADLALIEFDKRFGPTEPSASTNDAQLVEPYRGEEPPDAVSSLPFNDDADEPKTWRGVALSMLSDMFRYAKDEDPARRLVSASGYVDDVLRLERAA